MRRAPQAGDTDLFLSEIPDIRKFSPGEQQVDNLVAGKPNRARLKSSQRRAHRSRAHTGEIPDLAARQRRVGDLRSSLNDLRLEVVFFEGLPSMGGE